MNEGISRRRFLAAAAAAAAAPGVLGTRRAAAEAKWPMVCIFTKHLQFLDYGELAKVCKDIGVDGVDIPVRKGGHVLPENVATDLPRAADAVRAEGLEVGMITTELCRGVGGEPRPILETAAKLGIKYVRIGQQKYDGKSDPFAQLAGFTEEMRQLAPLLEEFDLFAGYHNHSGKNNVGGPLWDLHHMLRETNSPHIGSNFDPGHAAIEGAGEAWMTNMRLLAPYAKMMAVKDFVWGEDGKHRWVPLGQGFVQTVEFLKLFREHGFNGPISIHIEYKEYEEASREGKYEEIRRSAAALREMLKAAGYA